MAIESNDLNVLNRVQIIAQNNVEPIDDIRSTLFFTTEFDIAPTLITKPKDLLDLHVDSLNESTEFYKMVASAFSQKSTPTKLMVYGNKTKKTSFTEFYQAYKDHANSTEVYNLATNMNIKDGDGKTFFASAIEYAKTDKLIFMHFAIKRSLYEDVTDIYNLQTNTNAENIAFYIEGDKNITLGNWLIGAVVGGVIGAKPLGSYIVHASQIIGFVKENYPLTEQQAFKDKGLNYLAKLEGYFTLINGLASDNKMYIDLYLAKIWLARKISARTTILQITQDKLSFKNDKGIEFVRSAILSSCKEGADAGIFLTNNQDDYFGLYQMKGDNGKPLTIKLGHLNLKPLTQENIKRGQLNFDLLLTYDSGVREVTINGVVTTSGELFI